MRALRDVFTLKTLLREECILRKVNMMVPKKSLILAGAALALFGASASAQSQSGKVFARYNKPLKSVSLDLETGTLTRGPLVQDRTGATCSDLNNIDLGGFVGVDTGDCFCQWFDASLKGTGPNQTQCAAGGSNMINNIIFAFCSAKLYVASGGVGSSLSLGFYEGYTVGGGAPTTACAVFTLTGLPGHTADSSFFGGFTCYFINVTFGTLINCGDGAFGYSWTFMDLGNDGVLAGTWPFLSCVQSCSCAPIGASVPDGQGMTDLIDEYCPRGTLRATFTFGTTPFGECFTSMSMDVRELQQLPGTVIDWNGNGANVNTLVTSSAVMGGNWTSAVSLGQSFGSMGPITIKVRGNTVNGPTVPSPVGGRPLEVLVAGAFLADVNGTHNGTTGGGPPQAVPKDKAFYGFAWAAQATIVGGGFANLTDAKYGITGTQ
jgi:hypothetical protein